MLTFDGIESICYGDMPSPRLNEVEQMFYNRFGDLVALFQQGTITREEAARQKELLRQSYQEVMEVQMMYDDIGDMLQRNFAKMVLGDVEGAFADLIADIGKLEDVNRYTDLICGVVDFMETRWKERGDAIGT